MNAIAKDSVIERVAVFVLLGKAEWERGCGMILWLSTPNSKKVRPPLQPYWQDVKYCASVDARSIHNLKCVVNPSPWGIPKALVRSKLFFEN